MPLAMFAGAEQLVPPILPSRRANCSTESESCDDIQGTTASASLVQVGPGLCCPPFHHLSWRPEPGGGTSNTAEIGSRWGAGGGLSAPCLSAVSDCSKENFN